MQLILNYTDYMFETKGSMQLIAWLSIVRQIIKYTFIYPQNLFLQQKDQLSVTSIVTNWQNLCLGREYEFLVMSLILKITISSMVIG